MGGGSVLGGPGTLMSTAGNSVGAPPGSLMHSSGGGGGNASVNTPGSNVYGNGSGAGNAGSNSTAPVSVVVSLPGGPGVQHPGQALSDYGPI
ncbi:glycine-rich RNA-binding protein 5, mitochondrial-like [Glossina fuscipes]|uniref:Glycine-rich RNA-binding protein 5, mitochondrial-like n=2 Tax=Nemorhina TaxID=44051 RepID=A0A9C6E2G9_9MUSC|nr:glycine-rich RNA-binding protein 5, mitochondrial-like [Glossina fuscipes]